MKAGIAGAGIMGRLLAFSLVNAGWEVSLFDENDAQSQSNCSMSAAGLLSPIAELEKSDDIIFQLGSVAIQQYWPHIINQLGIPVDFDSSGSLVLAHPRDRLELDQYIHLISRKLTHKHVCEKLNQNQIAELEPAITKFQEGYFFHKEGYIDNQTLLQSLEQYLQHKIQWHNNTFVQAVEPFKIIINNQAQQFDKVFDCRGLGAKSQFSNLRGLRGELIWLHAPEVEINRPIRFLHPRYSLYIVPRSKGKYILGASEIESEDSSAISVRTALELLTAAYYVHAGFAEARIIKTITQCRPTLPDHLPKIKYCDGFVAINGLYRHGILIAPSLMMDVMRYLERDITTVHFPLLWRKHDDHCVLEQQRS